MQTMGCTTLVLGHGEKTLLYRFEESECGAQWMQQFARSYQERTRFDIKAMEIQRKFKIILSHHLYLQDGTLLTIDVVQKQIGFYTHDHGFASRVAKKTSLQVPIPCLSNSTLERNVLQLGLGNRGAEVSDDYLLKKVLYIVPTLI